MKRLAGLAIVAALAFGPMSARADMKALEEAAKKEGELTWYTTHYTSEAAEELGAVFTKMYGIKVNVVRTTAQVAYQRATQDFKTDQTDLRRLLDHRHGPCHALQGRGPAGEVRSREHRRRSPRRSATSIPTASSTPPRPASWC